MTNKNDLASFREPLKYEEEKRKSIKSVSKKQLEKVPSNWHELKRIEIQKSKEPILISITEPYACEEKRMVLIKPSEREIQGLSTRSAPNKMLITPSKILSITSGTRRF